MRRTRSFDENVQRHDEAVRATGAHLKQRYAQIEQEKKSRQIAVVSPAQLPQKRKAPSAAGGGGSRARL